MAADGTSIKNDIDSNLANKGYRGIRIATVITVLKSVVDWVTTAINTNLSTWLKVGGGVSGANTDTAYRTGTTILGRATDDASGSKVQVGGNMVVDGGMHVKAQIRAMTYTPNANSIATMDNTSYPGIMVEGRNNGPTFLAFHRPGQVIHYLGVDVDNQFVFKDYLTNAVYAVQVNGLSAVVRTSGVQSKRKLVFYQAADNDHQFFGIGMISSQMVYQVPTAVDGHVFLAGSSPATSVELMRIHGGGAVLIGTSSSNGVDKLQVNGSVSQGWRSGAANPTTANVAAGTAVLFKNTTNSELRLWANDGGVMKSVILMS